MCIYIYTHICVYIYICICIHTTTTNEPHHCVLLKKVGMTRFALHIRLNRIPFGDHPLKLERYRED